VLDPSSLTRTVAVVTEEGKISSYFYTYGHLCGTNGFPSGAARVVGKGP
jgi:hypothetical protein